MNASIRNWSFRYALLAALAGFPSTPHAKSMGCDGVFRHASDGFLFSEGGLEPTDAPRQIGDADHFIGFDLDAGKRYLVSEKGDVLYPAAYVELSKGCQLKRITKY